MVLGIPPPWKIPPGTVHPSIFPQGMFPPEKKTEYILAALFRFVARFARVRIDDYWEQVRVNGIFRIARFRGGKIYQSPTFL